MSRYTRRDFIKLAGGFVSAATLTPGLLNAVEAQENRRFNVLFLMTDQHHHGVMGCAGNPVVKTPNLDRLASEGARFTNAVCSTPFCSPTRASLLTGLWPHTHGVVQNVDGIERRGLDDKAVATEQILFDTGYKTYQMGKWHLGDISAMRCYSKDKEDTLSEQAYKAFVKDAPRDKWPKPRDGEVQIDDIAYAPDMAKFHNFWKDETKRTPQDLSIIGRQLIPAEYTYESWLTDKCTDLIKKHKNDNFMITWSVGPPHAYWVVPDPFYSMYDPDKMPLSPSWNDQPKAYQESQPARLGKFMGEKGVRETLRCYYGQVSMVDWCIGRILSSLDEHDLAKDTLVVFLSDHGDMQSAHHMVDKAMPGYYEDIVRVPMLVRYPKTIKQGKIINTHAGSVDIMPTLLDYAGQPVPEGVQGVSLRPLLEGKASDDDRPAFCERGLDTPSASRMIRTRRWKYAIFGKQRRELFDLQNDPYEMTNLADDSSYSGVMAKLHKQLLLHMETTGDPALQVIPNT